MRSRKSILFLTLLALLALIVGACSSETPAPTEVAPTEPPEETLDVALVLSGPISDASWNAAAYNAITSLEDDYNLSLEYTENVGLPDIEPTYRGYADQGFDVIIGHGFQFGDPAIAVAPDFPDCKWGVVMGIVGEDNVTSLNFREEESGYLAGYVAGALSESGVVGGVGGEEIPSIIKMMEAFKIGARDANPDVEILITYTGTWVDPTAGYEAALAQINQGADVLFPVANLTSTGVYEAAEEQGVKAIGSEGDQCAVAPGSIVATATDNIDRVLEIMIESVANGTYEGGVNFYGLSEGAISFYGCEGALPDDLESKLDELRQQIIDGELEVPVILESTS